MVISDIIIQMKQELNLEEVNESLDSQQESEEELLEDRLSPFEEEEKRLQETLLSKFRELLKENCSKADLKEMLNYNKQNSNGKEDVLISRCASGMIYGALPKCPICKGSKLVERNNRIECEGNITLYTNCTFFQYFIERTEWKIPPQTKSEILKSFQFKKYEPALSLAQKKIKLAELNQPPKTLPPDPINPIFFNPNVCVNPKSGLSEIGHIFSLGSEYYSVSLIRSNNSYKIIQMIEPNNFLEHNKYWIYIQKGIIGEEGTHIIKEFNSKSKCLEAFKEMFKNKTGNAWKNRHNFVEKKQGFRLTDIDFGNEKSIGKSS